MLMNYVKRQSVWLDHICYAPPLIGGHQAMMLSDVCLTLTSMICLLHTSGLSREQRGLGRLKLAQR